MPLNGGESTELIVVDLLFNLHLEFVCIVG